MHTVLNNEVLNCYDCSGREGKNCNEKDRKCSSKKYCTKQIVKLGGGFQLTKSCSNINVLGVDNTCANYDVVTSPGGVAVRNKYSQCYCRNKQYCNSAPMYGFGFVLFITVSFLFLMDSTQI
ncbi:hypothetical protein NECAME_09219 [Necator americanus]|uniref:Protein sleepless n=1 Tax=Necator americanus TaxID=51031 RepID=W2TEY6_NECAM|nr:hypothetical protein NECAME_09219 [Necator americanus]ETN80378.1 hypothetical protein NECAME_09219 [Necator americanus]